MQINREQFEQLVGEAIDDLPEELFSKINNAAILVEDFPTPEQLKKVGVKSEYGLLGLFEGLGQAKKVNFGVVLPDRITLFRVPIMQSCSDISSLKLQISKTLKHEIAHHMGSDEKGAKSASVKN